MDTLLKAWAEDSDEAFAVLIARHGVIAIHKPYGNRNGKRMTLDTKSWMASTTKMMSGSLIMMLVDQELIHLDDTSAEHLPPPQGRREAVAGNDPKPLHAHRRHGRALGQLDERHGVPRG